MHEGLIVLSSSDMELKLASRPAVRLIQQLPDIEEDKEQEEEEELKIETEDFYKPLFTPIQVSLINAKGLEDEKNVEATKMVSLDHIVKMQQQLIRDDETITNFND